VVSALKQCLENYGPDVAACAPKVFEKNSQRFLPFIKKNGKFGSFKPSSGCHEIFQTISSGTLLRYSAWEEIGPYNTFLFLDWVDLEWCWRAWKKGYRILGHADVMIVHRLGDKAVRIMGRPLWHRPPQRIYYIVRNALFLSLRCPYLNICQRLLLLSKSLTYPFIYTLFLNSKQNILKASLKGLWHGITGKGGEY